MKPTRLLTTALPLLLVLPIGLAWLTAHGQTPAPQKVDVLITQGMVIDGTGAPRRKADVAIQGDRIVFVGDASTRSFDAQRTINANGLVVAPGFIDPHTHADSQFKSADKSHNQPHLLQGVTSVFVGNDGRSPWPIGQTLQTWTQRGIGTNVGIFIGHGTVRETVMGKENRAPTDSEMQTMRTMVTEGMQEGALGLSTGLFYAPGVYATTNEVVELAKISARHGGSYDTHLRSESSAEAGFLNALREAIEVGRQAKLPVHISHIKALGTDVWGQSKPAIELINQARQTGLNVAACVYPYEASGTGMISALVPPWAQADGRNALIARVNDPALRERLDADVTALLKVRGGPQAVLFRTGAPIDIVKKRLSDLMAERQQTALEVIYDLIGTRAELPIVSFTIDEADITNFIQQPWAMVCSDSSIGHPRMYGSFPRTIAEYTRKRPVRTLEAIVHASSGMTARHFGIKDRGELRAGAYADVLVFDANTITDHATFEDPTLPSVGVHTLLVNGQITIDQGQYTGALAGQALRP